MKISLSTSKKKRCQ